MVGYDKPRMYYLEGVRRQVMLTRHEKQKHEGASPVMKQILRGIYEKD